jgi:hypothetical protein
MWYILYIINHNIQSALIMVMLNQASNGDKNKIYALVTTLTDLNPNAIEISTPIEESNILLKELTNEIDQLNTKDKLLKLAHLAVLEERLPMLKNEINIFILKLLAGKDETEKLCLDYERVIESLDKEAKLLKDNDPVKVDALGIVSINNLKLKNFKNQVHSAVAQIESLEKFKNITLYHLSDTINNFKHDKESPIINEIRRVISKLEANKGFYKGSLFLVFVLTAYNYLADNYHISYESTQKIAGNAIRNSANDMFSVAPVINFIQNVGMVMCTILMIFAVFNFAVRRDGSSISLIVLAPLIGLASLILPTVFEINETDFTYTEKIIQVSYDFYNFGFIGTLLFLGSAILIGILFFIQKKRIKQYLKVEEKLNQNNHEELVDCINKTA